MFLENLPSPIIMSKLPNQNWPLTWERLQSACLSPEGKSYFYLIIHERVRGHRLMPLRFPSNLCLHCGVDRDTYQHRYLYCPFVSEVWSWVWSIAVKLDPLISNYDNISILRLDFFKGLRENAILWLLGCYVEIVESEVVSKDKKLDLPTVIGHLKQKKQITRISALPDLGVIPCLDWDSSGIG